MDSSEIESHISLIKASYSPWAMNDNEYGDRYSQKADHPLVESGLRDLDYLPYATFSFHLNRKKFIINFEPTLGPTGPAWIEYMENLARRRKIHGQENTSTLAEETGDAISTPSIMPLEDELFREIMSRASPYHDGTSSQTDISKLLRLRPDIFKVDPSIPPLPRRGTHISPAKYQGLEEVLYPKTVLMRLKSEDGIPNLTLDSEWEGDMTEINNLHHTLPPEHPHLALYPQIPKISWERIKVIPYSNPWAVLHTVVVDETIMLFSPFWSGLIQSSIYYRPIVGAGVSLSWAFFKAGSITEAQSYEITRQRGYATRADTGHVVGVLFEWRDTSRRTLEELGPEFLRRTGVTKSQNAAGSRTDEDEERAVWGTKVKWENYLEKPVPIIRI